MGEGGYYCKKVCYYGGETEDGSRVTRRDGGSITNLREKQHENIVTKEITLVHACEELAVYLSLFVASLCDVQDIILYH